MKYFRIAMYSVAVLFFVFVLMLTVFKPFTYSLVGKSMKDFGVFGWAGDTQEQWQEAMPSLSKVETFADKKAFDEYLLTTYGPDQKVHFACTDNSGLGPINQKMKISEVAKFNCDYGFFALYKFQLP